MDTAFSGFHRLESALFRDNMTDASKNLLLTNKTMQAWVTELEAWYVELGKHVDAVRLLPACSVFRAGHGRVFPTVMHTKRTCPAHMVQAYRNFKRGIERKSS
jgi:hypothetical protein